MLNTQRGDLGLAWQKVRLNHQCSGQIHQAEELLGSPLGYGRATYTHCNGILYYIDQYVREETKLWQECTHINILVYMCFRDSSKLDIVLDMHFLIEQVGLLPCNAQIHPLTAPVRWRLQPKWPSTSIDRMPSFWLSTARDIEANTGFKQ